MPYSQLLPLMLPYQRLEIREYMPPSYSLPRGHDANAHCEFHSGTPGHTIDNSRAFKYNVQDLLDANAITFTLTGMCII